MEKLTVALLNDSFPPTIDGVANAVFNYADIIQKKFGTAVVATPYYPDVTDCYAFEVIRYSSANVGKRLEYRAGYPLGHSILLKLADARIDIIHTHCPFSSTILARRLRRHTGAPIILTYHTKFDLDIEKRIAYNPLRKASIRFLLSNIHACDEVWVVSDSAGENLRKLGYTGEYRIMENGVDFQPGKSPEEECEELRRQYDLSEGIPTFLYVGRMMWYKGIRLTVDALAGVKAQGLDFKMIFVGEGSDREDIMGYVVDCGLRDQCVFTGAVHNRKRLRAFYSVANLFLFPSTYDTNGIVVREAAACGCPSLLIHGSGAAEKVIHEETGILTCEDPQAISVEIIKACEDPERLARIGNKALEKLYLSWEDAVGRAYERYEEIVESHRTAPLSQRKRAIRNRNSPLIRENAIRKRVNLLKRIFSLRKS